MRCCFVLVLATVVPAGSVQLVATDTGDGLMSTVAGTASFASIPGSVACLFGPGSLADTKVEAAHLKDLFSTSP